MRAPTILATLAITLAMACGGKEAPHDPPSREAIAYKYAAGDLEIRDAPGDDAALITTYKTGEAGSILAASKADVGSTADHVRFRVPPEPVTQPGVHGVIQLEATVNVHGDVTGVRTLENTTGRRDLEVRTSESLRKAKFFPLLQSGKAQQFVYEYTATF